MDDEQNGRTPDAAAEEPVWELEQLFEEPRSDLQALVARSVRRRLLMLDVLSFSWAAASHAVAVLLGTIWNATGAVFTAKEDRNA